MSNSTGPLTLDTVGTGQTFSGFGFQPKQVHFHVGAEGGSSSTNSLSIGSVGSDKTQWAISEYDDHAGNYSYVAVDGYCILVRKHTAGGWVDVIKAKLVAFTSDGFKLDVLAADPGFKVYPFAVNT